ncbi:MAG: DUF1460 domain-containing protein [Pseudomonadota bacterium]|nr:DUF1460 domain-containing protein [Pseudomonadota bacterium]
MTERRKDREILTDALAAAGAPPRRQPGASGDIILRAGCFFLDAPYEAHTLETSGDEALVVNLRRFDCFTLVESCCALALLACRIIMNDPAKDHRPPDTANEALANVFTALLQTLRYRDGVIDGYASRLHYFADWVDNNRRGGLLIDATPQLGGRPDPRAIDFMTKHRELYPPLQDDETFHRLRAVEERLSTLPRHILPKEEIARWEERIAPGDILAIATREEGLDVAHMGLAIHRAGRLHLLHASSEAGKVIVSPKTLAAYLQGREDRAGVIVVRLKERRTGRRTRH